MRTDWLLIRKAAQELEEQLKRSKVQDAGRLSDGRIALQLWSRGTTQLLCFDVFGSPPLVTLELGELSIVSEPGFIRSLITALRGTTLLTVQSREHDRVLRLDFGTRSRFGISTLQSLIVELIPRFGNVILTKDLDDFQGGTVISALREFSLAENQIRAIESGRPYHPPPLLRKDVMCHPEERVEDTFLEGSQDVLALFARWRVEAQQKDIAISGNNRRNALSKALAKAEQRIKHERASIDDKREKAQARETLRTGGEAIFATLHELDEAARGEAKDRAAKLFAQYRKLGSSIPHLDKREKILQEQLDGITNLQWELERADDTDLPDVEESFTVSQRFALSSRAKHAVRSRGTDSHHRGEGNRRQSKRKPLEFRTPAGSRILVGRSPLENAELTFRVAQPDDLWFHVQAQPGAHVILHRDDHTNPSEEDLIIAAQLAAYHSKARASAKVAVDYTHRKHVRKRPNATPGLVFYTHASTKIVEPTPLKTSDTGPGSVRSGRKRERVNQGPGLLFVVSGPSGAGKDTLVEALLTRMPRLRYSVSATTREPRPGEHEGEHYFFMTPDAFKRQQEAGGFLESREYNSNLYGTPRTFVERTLHEGYDLIMKPEVNGALAVKHAYPDAVLIFLLPDRFSSLRERLLARRTETTEEIAHRLEIAYKEVGEIRNFDYIVINAEQRSDEAVRDLEAILQAERFRIHRYADEALRTIEHS